ncbi:glycosyltransferase family 39 protein [Actinomadura hibisca]|uniref:glycosyltransferase family 39 protein n=1 Tax=Actinomadura hibisca TaxID=68565 RepID=UPI0008333002|nr:glycosyltransferase family 39 protein [Actinomadura hibisca]
MTARRAAVPLAAALAALAVGVVGVGGPSFWLDEAATVSVTGRPTADMLRVFERLDLVHALYYLVMRPWVVLFGTGEAALRLPGVLATAGAAAGVAVIGRRLAGTLAGLAAGLVFAGSVTATLHAQEARPYAMVAAAAVLATYLLVRALDAEGSRRRWWWAGYGASIVVVSLFNLDAVLLVPAHGCALLLSRSRPAGALWRWLVAAGSAGVLLVPFAVAAFDQKVQVDWLPAPSPRTVWKTVEFLAGGPWPVYAVLALAVLGAVAGRAARGAVSLTAVAVPWLVLPPVVLLVVSAVSDPMFMFRYVYFCVPAMALLAGAGVARLAELARPLHRAAVPVAAGAALVLLAGLSVPGHVAARRQDGKPDDLRAAAQVIRERARDGDAIVYLAGVVRWASAAYPDAFGRLRDVSLRVDPVAASNIKGRDRPPYQLVPLLARTDRVWVMASRSIQDPGDTMVARRQAMVMAAGPWRAAGTWHYRGGQMTLYVRTGYYRNSR